MDIAAAERQAYFPDRAGVGVNLTDKRQGMAVICQQMQRKDGRGRVQTALQDVRGGVVYIARTGASWCVH